jgi:hypothetical protein
MKPAPAATQPQLRNFGATALDENSQHDHEEQSCYYLDDGDTAHGKSPFFWASFPGFRCESCQTTLTTQPQLRNFGTTALDQNSQHNHEKQSCYYLDDGDTAHGKSPFLWVLRRFHNFRTSHTAIVKTP